MGKKTKKFYKAIVVIIVIVIVIIFSSWAWLSYGQMTRAKERVFSVLPFPALIVSGRPVSMKSYIDRYHMAEVLAKTSDRQNSDLKTMVYDRLLEETIIQVLSEHHGVPAGPEQITAEYERRKAEFESNNNSKQSFEAALSSYGITPADYKNELVKSDIGASNLTTWFYSQKNLNQETYNKADEIVTKANGGEDFAGLASAFSEDEQTKNIGGDIGYIPLSQLLPEVQSAVQNASVGQSIIAPTRYGLEVIKVEYRDPQTIQSPKVRLRQIFLQGGDFNLWYKTEAKKLKVIKIVSL